MRKYSGAAVQGLAILLGMDKESSEIIRDQHNRGHDMTEWINAGLRKKGSAKTRRVIRGAAFRGDTAETLHRTIDLGNNESLSRGVFRNSDGTWTALTFAESRDFKTKRGAERWLARRSSK